MVKAEKLYLLVQSVINPTFKYTVEAISTSSAFSDKLAKTLFGVFLAQIMSTLCWMLTTTTPPKKCQNKLEKPFELQLKDSYWRKKECLLLTQ